jgi:hypothetical protein
MFKNAIGQTSTCVLCITAVFSPIFSIIVFTMTEHAAQSENLHRSEGMTRQNFLSGAG